MRKLFSLVAVLIISISCIGCGNDNYDIPLSQMTNEVPNPNIPADKLQGNFFIRNHKGEVSTTLYFDGLGYVNITDSYKTKTYAYSNWDENEQKLYFNNDYEAVKIIDENTIEYKRDEAYKENSEQDIAAMEYKEITETTVTEPVHTEVRCSWCGKVIRYDGVNIHAEVVLNGNTLKCDYCGHKTNFK